MGDRYILTVICPKCDHKEEEVYYAPTCGFKIWKCLCGHIVDLENYTEISEADCSNAKLLEEIIDKAEKKTATAEDLDEESEFEIGDEIFVEGEKP